MIGLENKAAETLQQGEGNPPITPIKRNTLAASGGEAPIRGMANRSGRRTIKQRSSGRRKRVKTRGAIGLSLVRGKGRKNTNIKNRQVI